MFGLRYVKKINYDLLKKIIAIIAVVIFFARYLSYRELQIMPSYESGYDFMSAAGVGPNKTPFLNKAGNILIWFETVAFLAIVCEPFFESKTTKFISLYVATPLILLPAIGMPVMMRMMNGSLEVGFTLIMFGIEIGVLLALTAMNWVVNWRAKFYRPTIIKGIVSGVIFLIFALPTYLPVSLFGPALPIYHVKNLTMTHRIFIYLYVFIPPLPLYFFLRGQSKSFIRYALLMISGAAMIVFTEFEKYDVLSIYLLYHMRIYFSIKSHLTHD